jgi:IclR family KDG regulon transcriptional repressor
MSGDPRPPVAAAMPVDGPRHDGADHAPVGRTSFSKGLGVLVVVARHGSIRADAIAEALGLSLSSTYRYLAALTDARLVTSGSGTYAPGPVLVALSARRRDEGHLIEVAQPVLEELMIDTHETALLTVRSGTHAVCIAQVESPETLRMSFHVGDILSLHAGAGQRILLAFAPATVIEHLLGSALSRPTPETLSADALRASLAVIRRERVAVSKGELMVGAVAIAAPVVQRGRVVAAITVAGPRERCNAGWTDRARGLVMAAAARVGAALDS